MESTPIRVQPDQWGEVIIEGDTVACKRHVRQGKIFVLNNSTSAATFTVRWLNNVNDRNREAEIAFQLVPGGMLEFDDLESDETGFGPWIVLQHQNGGELEVVHFHAEEGLS